MDVQGKEVAESEVKHMLGVSKTRVMNDDFQPRLRARNDDVDFWSFW